VLIHARMRTGYVSRNRVAGCLSDVGLDRLLAECQRQQVTGTIDVAGGGRGGSIELRLGVVESVAFDRRSGDDALAAIERLIDGTYELVQRLPDVDGSLGTAAELRADGSVTLIDLMRHCEQHALSCTITALADFDLGTVVYRAGEIVEVTLNGRRDDDAIVDMTRWRGARFRVAAPPLSPDIEGWPVADRARTAPFVFRAGIVDMLPPHRRRPRAPTVIPESPPHRANWGDLLWNCVAYAIARVGDGARARNAAAPSPPEPPPTRRQRLRRVVARWRRVLRRRIVPWRTRASTIG